MWMWRVLLAKADMKDFGGSALKETRASSWCVLEMCVSDVSVLSPARRQTDSRALATRMLSRFGVLLASRAVAPHLW
jgi:hypothetical protein